MKRILCTVLACSFFLMTGPAARADVVGLQAVSGTASSTFPSWLIEKTFDQSDLSTGYTSGVTPWATISTIDMFTFFNGWHDLGVGSGTLAYDMGGIYQMDRVKLFWMNGGTTNNIADFTIEVDDNAGFSSPTLVHTHFGSPTSNKDEFFFTSAEIGQYLRINWSSMQGDFAGLNEIIVGGSAIPEPGTLLICSVFAGAGLVFNKRRRNVAC